MSDNWLTIDRAGLAKTLEGRPKAFILFEALQNAFDEAGVTRVAVTLQRVPNSPFVEFVVVDDAPDGWHDLTHAYTMFAESKKKGDATKRGRFNVGEKWILALARYARIVSTTGGVEFDEKHGRRNLRARCAAGSVLAVEIRMTDQEMREALDAAKLVVAPKGVAVSINGTAVLAPKVLASFEATLPTVRSDDEGVLRNTQRKTEINVYEPRVGRPHLLEMGIPVVEIDCEWSIDVGQRVPLNIDRDNVTPAYRAKLLALVTNHMAEKIEDASAAWVSEAIESSEIEAPALEKVLDKRYGEKRVMFDPSDLEANKRATAAGYTVVHGRSIGRAASDNIRRFRDEGNDLLKPAGKVTPSTAAIWDQRVNDNPNAERMEPVKDLTPSEVRAVAYAKRLVEALVGKGVPVNVYPHFPMGIRMAASWGKGGLGGERLSFYRPGMKHLWDDQEKITSLVIHECGHSIESDHLSEKFHDAVCDMGAKLVTLARQQPRLFRWEQ